MIGFDLPWFVFPLILIAGAPWLAFGGALAVGYVTYRLTSRARGLKASLGAVAGSQVVPLVALAALEGTGGATTRLIGVGFLVVAGVAILVITRLLRAPRA